MQAGSSGHLNVKKTLAGSAETVNAQGRSDSAADEKK
jgi:hypothetical protein